MFDWKTDDDEGWNEPATAVPAPPANRFSRLFKRLMAGWVVVVVLVGGFWLAYRQVDSQATAVTNTIEQAVLAADQLVIKTAVAGDQELLSTLISARRPDWADQQSRLLARNLLFDRAPLGLWLESNGLPSVGWEDNTNGQESVGLRVTLSPDLQQAELVSPLPYVTVDAAGELQEITLQRTAVYHKQQDAWLLTEPGDEFWGEYVQIARPFLNLTTPERDAQIAERLADDLSDLLAKLCAETGAQAGAQAGADCPPGFTLQVRLFHAPDSLFSLYSPFRLSTVYLDGQQTTLLSLPAPTLVGLPVDEAGYQVMYRGYAAQMALAVLNMFANDAPVFDFRGTLSVPDFAPRMNDLGLFMPWPPEYNPLQAIDVPPIPFPDQDILLMCQSSRSPSLFRYDLGQDGWQDVLLQTEGLVNNSQVSVLRGQGILLTVGPSVRDNLTRLVWLNDGRETVVWKSIERFYIQGIIEPSPGRFVVRYGVLDSEDDLLRHAAVLDTNCEDDSCKFQPFQSAMQLSPDGRHSLIVQMDQMEGFVYAFGDADGHILQEFGPAHNPFWLDEQTLALIRPNWRVYARMPDLVTAIFPEDEMGEIDIQVELTGKDMWATYPDMSFSRGLMVEWVGGFLPSQPDEFFVLFKDMSPIGNDDRFLAKYNWQRKELSFLELPEGKTIDLAGISPNGRFLLFYDEASVMSILHLYDRTTQTWQEYEQSSALIPNKSEQFWSADGNWLALLDGDTIRLVAPAYNYEKLVYHGLEYCETVAWMN